MLTSYIQAAMHRAVYKLLEDKTFFGEIPELKGLWANAKYEISLADSRPNASDENSEGGRAFPGKPAERECC